MSDYKLKYRWLHSKLLEYQCKIMELEEGGNDPRKDEYRQILLERLEWVWQQLGELQA